MELDIRTILFFFFLVTTFVVCLLWFYILITKSKAWYLKTFVIGKTLLAIGLITVSLRGQVSDFLSIGFANAIVFLAMAFEMYSFLSIDGKFRKNLAYAVFGGTFFICLLFLLNMYSPDSLRVIIAAIPGVIFSASTGLYLMFLAKDSKFSKLIGLFYLLLGLMYVARAISVWGDISFTFMVTSSWIESVFFMVNALIVVVGTIGFVLILKEQQEFKILENNNELNELNATKDKFFSIIAHDLRGPIGALNNMGKVLLDQHGEITNEDREELINAVIESSGIALDLLNNLLYWAQSESGNLKVNTTKFRPTDLLTRAALIFKEAANLKDIKLTVPRRSDTAAWADMEMIDTVVRNLFSNAIKFTPNHGEIKAGFEVKDDHIEMYVKDSGVGMTDDIQAKLFRLDSDYTTKGTNMESGSGLGLKLCKEFVEKNNGKIWVVSGPGKGSTFRFTLNRATNEPASSKIEKAVLV